MDREQERKAGRAYHTGVVIFILLFGIFWTVAVIRMGAWFMAIFGLFFVGIAVFRLCLIRKFTGEKKKEREPWEHDQHKTYTAAESIDSGCRHCPYCGEPVEQRFQFCPVCGRRLS